MDDWTVTLTLTLTLNLNLTLKKEKGKCFDLNLCFNSILKWTMTCETSVGISVKSVTFLSRTIFIVRVIGWRERLLRMKNSRIM